MHVQSNTAANQQASQTIVSAVRGCLGCQECNGKCAAFFDILTVPDVVLGRS